VRSIVPIHEENDMAEITVNHYDRLALERAALHFAEDRMESLRKYFTKVEYRSDASESHTKLRMKMMRQQIRQTQAQLAALDALLRLRIEGE
jgi:hypothetical protein